MVERKPARLDKDRPMRRAPDDYDAPAEQEDVGQEDVEEDEEYNGDALGAASADARPDVLLDVPVLKVEEIHLEVEDLNAQVSLQAEVLNLLKLHVGADVSLGRVSLEIKGVDAVAQLKVRLDQVAAIIGRVMATIDNNPEILGDLTRGLGEAASGIGRGAGGALEEVGRGAGGALEEVGAGAGSAVESVADSVGEAASDLGQGAGRAVEDVIGDTGDIADDALSPGREAAGSGREAERADQRPTGRAARRQADQPERPPPPSEDRPRRVRRPEPPATTTRSLRRDQEARRDRRTRPQ